MIDTTDAGATAEFWRLLLGLVYRPGHEPPPTGLALDGRLRLDRSDDPEEPLRVYADPAGHTFCVFVG